MIVVILQADGNVNASSCGEVTELRSRNVFNNRLWLESFNAEQIYGHINVFSPSDSRTAAQHVRFTFH